MLLAIAAADLALATPPAEASAAATVRMRSTAAQRRWHIESARLKPAPAGH
jgi:hypothetical protein